VDAPAATPTDITPRVGHLVLAVGRSWSNAVTATAGIVAVIGGPLPTGPGRSIERIIRTTAPMHGGFAGGALADASGRFLGLATAVEIRGLGVVIPADIVLTVAASLAEHGTARRGYVGIAGQPVELPARQREGDDAGTGLLIVGVSADSPADRAGLLVGDVVVGFDGRPVRSADDLLGLVTSDRVGQAVVVRVLRGGQPSDLTLIVGERP
jgi:S1-C subfamily serine protease